MRRMRSCTYLLLNGGKVAVGLALFAPGCHVDLAGDGGGDEGGAEFA